MLDKTFVGVFSGKYICCVACASSRYGSVVVKEIGRAGSQGYYFDAVYLGDKHGYDDWECAQCGKRLKSLVSRGRK